MKLVHCLLIAATVAAAERARADAVVLRMASPAPEGTAWAREGTALSRDIETLTHGKVRIKYYLGGITGDEMETAELIRRGQLDGIASGGTLCMKLAPSMRVLRVLGLFQSRDESAYVSGRLKQILDEEFLKAGFVNLGEVGVGPDVLFSREPIRNMADLKKTRLWVWDLDDMYRQQLGALGISMVPLPLDRAGRAFDEHKLDGWVAVPTAALAFQWSAQARYVSDLRLGFLRGCFLIGARSFDSLSLEAQQALRTAHAKTVARVEDLGRLQDDALLGGLFGKQGLQPVPVTSGFRAEFYDAARVVRERLDPKLVTHELLQRVIEMLADYRAEHTPKGNAH